MPKLPQLPTGQATEGGGGAAGGGGGEDGSVVNFHSSILYISCDAISYIFFITPVPLSSTTIYWGTISLSTTIPNDKRK